MTRKQSSSVTSLKTYLTYLSHFIHYCYVLRGLLGIHVVSVLLGGAAFARCESIPLGQGIYFALITSTTVGYGDITPKTGIGQCISVLLALIGTVFFGLVVAVATQAFRVTIREYVHVQGESPSN